MRRSGWIVSGDRQRYEGTTTVLLMQIFSKKRWLCFTAFVFIRGPAACTSDAVINGMGVSAWRALL